MRVRITHEARRDLEEIARFIGEDSPLRAISFVDELVERCLGLASHSARYPVVARSGTREFRRCTHGRYLIFYSLVDGIVEIDHVVHGSREYMRKLFPDS